MANKILWDAAYNSRGNVLTTEMNSLADGAYVAGSTVLANETNLDQMAVAEVTLASLSPTTGACVELYCVRSADGTTYEDAPATANPAPHLLLATIPIDTTASDAKFAISRPFMIEPGKTKFALRNRCGVALGASNNIVKIYTANDEIQG